MKILAISIILILLTASFPRESISQCKKVNSKETTLVGGNMFITLREKETYKIIAGNVQYPNGDIMEDALVEVFDKPNYLLCEWLPNNPNNCTSKPPNNQRRKFACKTGKNGSFYFNKLPAGKYELRVSKGIEWNVIHDVIVVNPQKANTKKEKIEIIMSLGG